MRQFLDNLNWLPQVVLDGVSDFVLVTDADINQEGGVRIVYANRSLLEATGYSEAELIGQAPRIFQGHLTDPATLARIKQGLLAGTFVTEEVLNYTKSGRPYWTELNISPVKDAEEKVRFFVSVQRDVTEKHLLKEAYEKDRLLFAVGEKIGDLGTWGYDVLNERVLWSDGAYKIFDLDKQMSPPSVEECLKFIAPDEQSRMTELVERCIDQGIPFESEFSGLTAKGAPLRLAVRAEALLSEDGSTRTVVGAIRDVTGQKHVADALIESRSYNQRLERHFATARLAAKIGVFDYSATEDLQYWSDELLEMTGLTAGSFPAPSDVFVTRIDPADRPMFDDAFTRALQDGEDYEITIRFHRPDGRMMYMHIIAEVLDVDQERRIVGIARDVTEEVEASAQLKRQEERFRIIADSVSDVLWDYGIEDRSFWVSPNWTEKLGIVADPASFAPERWVDFVAPEDRKATWASLLAMLKSDASVWRRQFRFIDTQNTKFDVVINASILRREDGRAYRMLGNLRNVTQENLQQEGFTRSRALEAVGQLTGGVAHDFNNLLMIIQGNAELLAMSELDEDDRESVQLINKASEAAANLTAKLLSFSGQTRLSSVSLNLYDLMAELLPLLRSGLTSAVKIETRIAHDVLEIEVDDSALEQAIINLAVNARDAMPMGGTLQIAVEPHVVSDDMIGATYDLTPGQYVCISVSDTGEGMSEEVMSKACEPFFTTKDVGKGTGLGLSSVYGFAKQSGGALQLYSELGNGTTVKLYLPVSDGAPRQDKPLSSSVIAPAVSGKRVLVVEDQPEVRGHVEKLLRRAGFAVMSAEDAKTALDILNSDEAFDVLFTDVVMPGGMNGVQLAEAAAKIAPRMKVLFTSGFPSSAFDEVGVRAWDDFDLLQKPYRSTDLIASVTALVSD